MKKWIIITNVSWFLVVCFLAFYANVQSGYAEGYRLKAESNAAEAKLQEEKAIEYATLARQAQAEAELQRQEAVRSLQECENR